MDIYPIDARIRDILSQQDEDGNLPESAFDELEALAVQREIVIENSACLVLDLVGDAKKIREQELVLAKRRQQLERRAERIKQMISDACDGSSFSSPRVQVRFGKSTAVEIDEELFWEHPATAFVRYVKPEPDKNAIKAALKDGGVVPGAVLVERRTMTIK